MKKEVLNEKSIVATTEQIARNLLSLGLPIDQITQATGLTEEEIELLKES